MMFGQNTGIALFVGLAMALGAPAFSAGDAQALKLANVLWSHDNSKTVLTFYYQRKGDDKPQWRAFWLADGELAPQARISRHRYLYRETVCFSRDDRRVYYQRPELTLLKWLFSREFPFSIYAYEISTGKEILFYKSDEYFRYLIEESPDVLLALGKSPLRLKQGRPKTVLLDEFVLCRPIVNGAAHRDCVVNGTARFRIDTNPGGSGKICEVRLPAGSQEIKTDYTQKTISDDPDLYARSVDEKIVIFEKMLFHPIRFKYRVAFDSGKTLTDLPPDSFLLDRNSLVWIDKKKGELRRAESDGRTEIILDFLPKGALPELAAWNATTAQAVLRGGEGFYVVKTREKKIRPISKKAFLASGR